MVEKVIAALLGTGDLPARIGNRFGPLVLPAENQTPYVSWELTSRPHHTLDGVASLRRHDVVFTCWGKTWTAAAETARAVRRAVHGAAGYYAGGIELHAASCADLPDGVEAPQDGGERGVFHVDVVATLWLRGG